MTKEHLGAGWILCLGLSMTVGGCPRPGAVAPPAGPTTSPAGGPAAAPPPPAVQEVADSESDAEALQSRVTKVTVYSDRARVSRRATAQVTTDARVFAFRSLPGWVDDGSVEVAVSGGRIVDVRVDRAFLARANDASLRKVEADHRTITDRLAALRDELAVLDAQKAQIESIKAFSLAKITQDTIIGNVTVKTYEDVLLFISQSLRATAEARRTVQRRLDDLKPEYDASARRLEDARALMQLEETTVLVTLQAVAPTPVTVELTYMLPGVTWEPMHELRASTKDTKTVELVSFAAVTQTSGEDWGGADISFSTQSTVKPVAIPELEALTLGDTVTATRILTTQVTSFTRAQTAFQGQSQLWNKVHQGASAERARASFEQVYRSNIEYLEEVQGRTVKIFESLEKRGTTAHFQAQRVQSVRGDGHPVRLLIGRRVLGATQKVIAAPEQSLNAARTVAMTNTTDQPFLPGKVGLYQDEAFLGMTDIDFIAKGERFSLFLSVADHLKFSRELDRKKSAVVRKTRTQMQAAFIVTVENLSGEEASFTLVDRIPVSENREIRVDKVAIAPAVKPDSQGLLHWELTLKPGEKREFRISYQVEYPAELVIETNRRRAVQPAPANPYERAPSKRNIEDQITDIDNML